MGAVKSTAFAPRSRGLLGIRHPEFQPSGQVLIPANGDHAFGAGYLEAKVIVVWDDAEGIECSPTEDGVVLIGEVHDIKRDVPGLCALFRVFEDDCEADLPQGLEGISAEALEWSRRRPEAVPGDHHLVEGFGEQEIGRAPSVHQDPLHFAPHNGGGDDEGVIMREVHTRGVKGRESNWSLSALRDCRCGAYGDVVHLAGELLPSPVGVELQGRSSGDDVNGPPFVEGGRVSRRRLFHLRLVSPEGRRLRGLLYHGDLCGGGL